MRFKRARRIALKLIGVKKFAYPVKDVCGNTIWVCTKCGCHFIGDNCPSMRH